MEASANTQAVLLLTAPLTVGRDAASSHAAGPLKPSEYRRLARFLRDKRREPAAFLGHDADNLVRECGAQIDPERLRRLLGRGVLLGQALERWQARAIWVASRADVCYPQRLKRHLGVHAPPVLYGCGAETLVDAGGLAVVGSRHVDSALIDYTEGVGQLVAAAQRSVISGGARGIDQAAMRGVLEADGSAVGVLADSLERVVVRREYRDALLGGRLVLISPYDPAVGFKPWRAMERNKLIYALADAALVVNADYQKGGTWAGATEQLDELRFVPIYVRGKTDSEHGPGLAGLRERGARPWPDPKTPEDLEGILRARSDAERSDRKPTTQMRRASTDGPVGDDERQSERVVRAQGLLPLGR